MEKTVSKKKSKAVSKSKLKEHYIKVVLMSGRLPASIYAFAQESKISEDEFYSYFNSFGALEREIWADWMAEAVQTVQNDEAFVDYSVREKLLALFFTWIEVLKENRSYVLMRFEKLDERELNPEFLIQLKHVYKDFIHEMIMEGKDTTEIAERPFSNLYDKGFWLHLVFLTRFWVKDDTKDYEQTDAAVEKSVNFIMDLIAKGPLDSFVDFAKFLYQNRKPY